MKFFKFLKGSEAKNTPRAKTEMLRLRKEFDSVFKRHQALITSCFHELEEYRNAVLELPQNDIQSQGLLHQQRIIGIIGSIETLLDSIEKSETEFYTLILEWKLKHLKEMDLHDGVSRSKHLTIGRHKTDIATLERNYSTQFYKEYAPKLHQLYAELTSFKHIKKSSAKHIPILFSQLMSREPTYIRPYIELMLQGYN